VNFAKMLSDIDVIALTGRLDGLPVVSWSRLNATDWELGRASVGSAGPSRPRVSSVIYDG